jgi:ABC-type Fe3+-siderophore transport system permease subunit
MNRKSWTLLRLAVLAAAALGTLFWLGSLMQWTTIPDSHRDGFELIGVALSTAFFVVLVLPALVLALLGRWLVFAAMLGAAVIVLSSDTLFHWLPWW